MKHMTSFPLIELINVIVKKAPITAAPKNVRKNPSGFVLDTENLNLAEGGHAQYS